jgi:hypothetical protein
VESGLIAGNELFSSVEMGDNFLDLLLLDNKFTSQKIDLRVMRGVNDNGRGNGLFERTGLVIEFG